VLLLGLEDHSHAASAKQAQNRVSADLRRGTGGASAIASRVRGAIGCVGAEERTLRSAMSNSAPRIDSGIIRPEHAAQSTLRRTHTANGLTALPPQREGSAARTATAPTATPSAPAVRDLNPRRALRCVVPELHASAATFPAALRERTQWVRLAGVPALIALPEATAASSEAPQPIVLWIHGRTVNKELDPGRYLRWIRAGFIACALDLPGHGERFDPRLQAPEATLEVVELAAAEIDGVIDALHREAVALGLASSLADARSLPLALGGMSLGGMVAMVRLCRGHSFRAASVEATTGSWDWQAHRAMWDGPRVAAMNPIAHLDAWREIPFQAIHAKHDEWVALDGQREFVEALRSRATRPDRIVLEVFEERTGAPHEHAGFGRFGAEAKDRQLAFWQRYLRSH